MAILTVNPSRSGVAFGPASIVWAPLVALMVFLALPWSIEHKAHVALHGLCAQQVTHTYALGDRLLPFDARMTGIYSGFLVTSIVLWAKGAQRYCRPPSISRLVILIGFGGTMAADGMNSLLVDLGRPYLYQPRNDLRLITGALAGVVLAVALCFLTSSLWTKVDPRRETLESLRALPVAGLAWVPIGLAVASGQSALYVPLTLLLLTSAAMALTILALVLIVIFARRDYSFTDVSSLGGYRLAAMGSAFATMACLSAGRSLLERLLGT